MAIKPLTKEEIPKAKAKTTKLSSLINDIHEAIENKVEYWEFVDYPYSLKTPIRDVLWHAKKALAWDFKSMTGISLHQDRVPLVIEKAKDEDGNIHIYGSFNYRTWEKLINEAKGKQNDKNF